MKSESCPNFFPNSLSLSSSTMKSQSRPCHSAPASIIYGQMQQPRKNDIRSESDDGCTLKTKKKCIYLRPVLPFSSGEGLPYAPIDWPSQGDYWGWKVGRKISKSGVFRDRFLYLPAHLQKPGCRKYFTGRMALEQYIRTEFPGAEIDAFFASFSWEVRANKGDCSKVNIAPRPRKRGQNDEDEETTRTSARKRKRKPASVPSTCRRQTRQSFKRYFPSTTKHEVITIDLTEETETSISLTKDLGSASENDEVSSNQNSVASAHCSIGTSLSHVPREETVMDVCQEPLVETNSEDLESKEKAAQVEAEIDSIISAKRETEDQIAQLQSRCAELEDDVGVRILVKNDLLSTQRNLADSLSSVKQKVELGMSKKQELELMKAEAAKRVAEILAKYAS